MNNFDTLFPNFLTQCTEMNHLLTPIAFVLLAIGIVSSTVTGRRSPSAYLRTIGRRRQLGYYWRTSLQEPVALLWILPLCFFLGTWVPAIFFVIHLAMDYSVGYEKMPWYPYSPLVTQGFLVGVSDKAKEAILIVVLLCMNLLLFLAPL